MPALNVSPLRKRILALAAALSMRGAQASLRRNFVFAVGGGFALALLLMAAITLVSLDEMSQMNTRLEDIVRQNNVKTRLATEMRDILRDRAISMLSIVVMTDEFEKDEEMLRFYRYGADYSMTRIRLATMLTSPEERAALERIDTLTRINQPIMVDLVDLGMDGYTFLAFEVLQTQAIPIQHKLVRELDALIAIQRNATKRAAEEAQAAYDQTRWLLVLLGLAAALVSALVAVFVIRRTARQAAIIEREHTKYRTLFETNTDGIVILDEGGFTDCNPATLRMFRFDTVADFLGRKPDELGAEIQPSGAPAREVAARHIREAMENRHALFEWTGRRADGSLFPVEIALHAMQLDGRTYIQAIMRDVTAQKAAEEALKAAHDAALSAAEMKSQFVANVSHEIRTPMNGIIGMTRLLIDSRLAPRQHEYAEAVLRSAESLMRIINEILDFSKIEAGRLSVEEIDFELPELLREVMELYAPRAEEKRLAFRLEGVEAMPAWVRGDPLRLRQVLLNLLDNALKFTERGEVRLAARRLAPRDGLDWYRFSVRDSGIGIPAAALERIFQAFSQADGSTSRKYGGTGLGLAICRQLVELMGGALRVESRVGEGSAFHVDLPLAPGSAEAALAGPELPPRLRYKDIRVLLAEDNPVNQKLLRYTLENMGVEVEVAGDGQAAYAAARAAPPDLIFMDCQMPEWDGLTASQAIRTWESGQGRARLPIIALTANAMEGFEESCHAAGMDDYLTKPVSAKDLAVALARWLPDKVEEAEPEAAPEPGPAADSSPHAYDLDKLRQISRGDPARLQELLDVFVESSAGLLESLAAAIAAEDAARATRDAHQIKGAAAFIGAQAMAEAAGRLEQAARQADLSGAGARLAELQAAYARVRRQILAETPSGAAARE